MTAQLAAECEFGSLGNCPRSIDSGSCVEKKHINLSIARLKRVVESQPRAVGHRWVLRIKAKSPSIFRRKFKAHPDDVSHMKPEPGLCQIEKFAKTRLKDPIFSREAYLVCGD